MVLKIWQRGRNIWRAITGHDCKLSTSLLRTYFLSNDGFSCDLVWQLLLQAIDAVHFLPISRQLWLRLTTLTLVDLLPYLTVFHLYAWIWQSLVCSSTFSRCKLMQHSPSFFLLCFSTLRLSSSSSITLLLSLLKPLILLCSIHPHQPNHISLLSDG